MPSETLWDREEQTIGKHLVLQHYLDGWFPILGRWNGRLLFIDGFAGPGEYADGEPGSPLIALDCIRRHKEAGRLRNVEVVCLFIESNIERASHLQGILKNRRPPPSVSCNVLQGTFDEQMIELFDFIDKQNAALAPAFIMIDPFGVKGSPMHLIERILQNDKSECMVSFMYEPIRRFHQQPEFGQPLDELFGTTDWRKCLDMAETDQKKQYLHDLFKAQLKEHGAKQVVFFELWNGNKHMYTIYFASGSLEGCNLMKQAIWKTDRSGSYRVRGYAGSQPMLFETDTEPLAKQLQDRFVNRLTPVEDIEAFVMSDETMFHKGHLRIKTLQPLEKESRITVSRPQGGRGFTNGKGIKVRFH